MRDGRRLAEPAHRLRALVVDEHDHPDADLAAVAEQGRAVDPAGAAVVVGARDPADLGRDAAAFGESGRELFAHARGAADAAEECGLRDAGDAEGGRGEENAEGWVRTEEEVLQGVNMSQRTTAAADLHFGRRRPAFR